jgi:hypothetical protein
MKAKWRINPEARILYIPKDVLEEGFKGNVDVFINAATFTVVRPGASLSDVEASLKIMLHDISLRKRMSQQEKNRDMEE